MTEQCSLNREEEPISQSEILDRPEMLALKALYDSMLSNPNADPVFIARVRADLVTQGYDPDTRKKVAKRREEVIDVHAEYL